MTKPFCDYRSNDYFLLLGLIFIGLLVIDSIIFYFFNQGHYLKENGLIENIQVILLLSGFVFYSFHLLGNSAYKGIASVSTVICIGFLLREMDVEKIFPAISIVVTGKGKVLMLAILAGFSCYALFEDIKKHRLLRHIISPFSLCIIFCSDFLILSWLFDKKILDLSNNLIFEEMSEVNAYALIVVAAFFIPKKT